MEWRVYSIANSTQNLHECIMEGTCLESTGTMLASGIILCVRPANERRRYIVTWSLTGWAHTQNDACSVCTNRWVHQVTKSGTWRRYGTHAWGWIQEWQVKKDKWTNIQAYSRTFKHLHHWPFVRGTSGFPSQNASNGHLSCFLCCYFGQAAEQ